MNVAWSLTIEFIYYIFIGIFFQLLFSANFVARIVSNLLFLSLGYVMDGNAMWNFFHWAAYFGVGFYLYRVKSGFHVMESQVFLVACMFTIFFNDGFLPGINQLVVVALTAGLILWSPTMRSKHLLFLGGISYSLYLVHNFFGVKVFQLVEVLGLKDSVPFPIVLAVATLFSIGIALLFYRFVEISSHKWSKSIWTSGETRP